MYCVSQNIFWAVILRKLLVRGEIPESKKNGNYLKSLSENNTKDNKNENSCNPAT
jgi:hypothetical protein